jgi:carbonic anhydrase/SulP family sulfate permease
MNLTYVKDSFKIERSELFNNFVSGLIVFLVALPLCLGVALASGVPLIAGIVSGIVGGLVVGLISGSQTSVSGPSPGQVAVVVLQMSILGGFNALLAAIVVCGLFQIIFGIVKAGSISSFVPSTVIKGLLAAIGVILVLKQIPHILGHDTDPEGEMAFIQPDHENTFSEILAIFSDFHPGAATIGIMSVLLYLCWEKLGIDKITRTPKPLVVILIAVVGRLLINLLGGEWIIGSSHLVQVPVVASPGEFFGMFETPDFSSFFNPAVYLAGLTIALVASLETLLNLEAVDKIDPHRRTSPKNLELFAQGMGNIFAGLLGGLPIASVIVRSKLNLESGATHKISAVIHGLLLFICVLMMPQLLNLIPLSCLAAILFVTGLQLASPSLFVEMWKNGLNQFLPFLFTMLAIVLTDLLKGILFGICISLAFILYRNLKRPISIFIENHIGGEVIRFELANQVSFLNRASLLEELNKLPAGTQLLVDATKTHYIDNDILELIRDFSNNIAPARRIKVSLTGFQEKYDLQNQIQYVDYSSREMQEKGAGCADRR